MEKIQITDGDKLKIITEMKETGKYFMGAENENIIFGTRNEWLDTFVRPERNKLLQETDYLMLPDNVEMMTKEEYETLKIYRQDLRDLPENIISSNVIWPVNPMQKDIEK